MEPLITHRIDEAGPSRDDGQDQDDGFVVSEAISSPGFSKDVAKVSSEVTNLTLTDKLPVSLTDPFRYQALDNRPNRFRLLRLLPRRRAWIECQLYDSLISIDNQYEALSYVWGSDERVEPILLDGKEFWVTENLYAALRDLALPEEDRVLWVDGICIDQSNNAEKSQQVQRMTSIYSEAKNVLFWLGKATEEVQILMRFLQQLESRRDVEQVWSSLQEAYGLQKEIESGLVTLLRRPWFSRVWILQEVAKARLGLVCAGRMTVSSSVFALAPWLIGVSDENSLYWKPVIALMPGSPRDDNHWARWPDLYDLLVKTLDSQATDARDKVFALLGMSVNVSDRTSIAIDYDKPAHEVYQDLLRYLVPSQKSRVNDVLNIAHRALGVGTIFVLLQHMPPPQSDEESEEERQDRLRQEQDRLRREQDTLRYWTEVPFPSSISNTGQGASTATISKTDIHVFTWQLSSSSSSSVPIREGLYTEVLRMEEQALAEFPGRFISTIDDDARPVIHHWVHREGHVKLLCLKKGNHAKLLPGEKAEQRDSFESDTFEYAASNGFSNLLHLLVDLGIVQVQELILGHCNPLVPASQKSDTAMVETLLDMGFDPDGPARNRRRGPFRASTPLSIALQEGCHAIVKMLIERGADIDREFSSLQFGRAITPLGWALVNGQCSVVEFLVTKSTTSVPFHDKNTPHSIHCIPSLQMALDHGLDPSLILAVTLLDFEPDLPLGPVFNQALRNGANPNAAFGLGSRIMFEQSRIKYEDVVDGVGWNLKFSMLQLAILSGCHGDPSAKMKWLLQNGPDINQVAANEEDPEAMETALTLAVAVGCLACIQFLLDHGAHIDAQAYDTIDSKYALKRGQNNKLRTKMLLDDYHHKLPTDDGSLTKDVIGEGLPVIARESVYHNHHSDDRETGLKRSSRPLECGQPPWITRKNKRVFW